MLGGRGRRSPLSATERRFARARRGRGDRCGFCGGRYPRGRDRCPRLAIGMATPTGGGSGWPAGRKPAARARKVGSVAYAIKLTYALSTREKLRRESGGRRDATVEYTIFPLIVSILTRTCLKTQSQTCPTHSPHTRLTTPHTAPRERSCVWCDSPMLPGPSLSVPLLPSLGWGETTHAVRRPVRRVLSGMVPPLPLGRALLQPRVLLSGGCVRGGRGVSVFVTLAVVAAPTA